MSATLTWSENHGESNAQSTFGATNQGAIQLMNQYFTALAAFSDFPWTVCSHEGTTAPWFVTLKRKSGAPGRIVFIAVASAPGATYNPQLGSLSWSSAGVRAAYFPAATSDTPANILATSGNVFADPAGSTGGCASIAMTTGTVVLNAFACEDGILMRYGAAGADPTGWFVVGTLAEDNTGTEAGITCHFGQTFSVNPAANPNISSSGGFMMPAGVSIHYGSGWTSLVSPAGFLRDNGQKKAWFLPRSLASHMVTGDAVYKYKLRQIAIGPTPLAGHERLATVGNVLAAQSAVPTAVQDRPWLTNFQV